MEIISMDEVREIGKLKGVLSVGKYESKRELIRVIQLADGHQPCFMSGEECYSDFCMWMEECAPSRAGSAA